MEKPDLVVAFGFATAGEVNQRIALYAKHLSKMYGIKILTEEYVMPYLRDVVEMSNIIVVAREGRHLSTMRIIKSFKEFGHMRCERVMLVAAPSHRWRCARDLKKMGFKVIKDDYFKTHSRSSWYTPSDPMWWVRNPFFWWVREIFLRILPWRIYSKITA